jgi:hypothetical protein
MAGAVSAYERIKIRYPEAKGEDYLFLPDYPNRATASRIFQRQFNQLLDDTKLKFDPSTGMERSVYSLSAILRSACASFSRTATLLHLPRCRELCGRE